MTNSRFETVYSRISIFTTLFKIIFPLYSPPRRPSQPPPGHLRPPVPAPALRPAEPAPALRGPAAGQVVRAGAVALPCRAAGQGGSRPGARQVVSRVFPSFAASAFPQIYIFKKRHFISAFFACDYSMHFHIA